MPIHLSFFNPFSLALRNTAEGTSFRGGFVLGLIVGMSNPETEAGRQTGFLIIPAALLNMAFLYSMPNREVRSNAFITLAEGYFTGFVMARMIRPGQQLSRLETRVIGP